jgi:tetratricopeptide (TPR) repeat protein
VGDIYLEWRDFTQAANWYNKAIKIEKKAAGTYYSLAKLQFEMNQYDRALTILKQVFEINPYDFEGRILELRILDQKEDKDSLFKKTKVFVKDFPDKSEGFLFLGKVYLDWEKYRQAFEHYQKAIEVAPEMASSYNGMGNYYYERKEYGKARELYQKSLKLNPNYSHVYFNLGLVEWKEQKFAAAQKNFVQAYELNKWFKEAIFFSSICSMESGKPEEALNYLVNFYMKDAFLYYTNLRNPEYGPQMGRILQNFWKYNDRNDKFNRGLYVALVDSKGKALYLLKDDQNPKAMYVVARLYFLQNENEKGKQVFLNYLKKDNASREIILLDYSFNNVKGEPWFLKALEELQ